MWWQRQVPVSSDFSALANDPNQGLARHVAMGGSGGSKMYYCYNIVFPIDIIIQLTATAATT
jgi:hypothetical protein